MDAATGGWVVGWRRPSAGRRENVDRRDRRIPAREDRGLERMQFVIEHVAFEHAPDAFMSVLEFHRMLFPLLKKVLINRLARKQSAAQLMNVIEFLGIPVAKRHFVLVELESGGLAQSGRMTLTNRAGVRSCAQTADDERSESGGFPWIVH